MLSSGGRSRARRQGGTVGLVLSRRGDALVSQTQRARMLNSAVQVVSEHGYADMSVARITANAGVSRRTFYDVFKDREDCFLASFDETVARVRDLMLSAYGRERGWRGQTRAALLAVLVLLDEQPALGRLLVVDALKAGPRVQRRRAEILEELSRALHEAGSAQQRERALPALTGEGVVGAVLGVVHTRLLDSATPGLATLISELMGVIVLPYIGASAARRELARSVPTPHEPRVGHRGGGGGAGEVLASLPMRITRRTLLVLTVIAESPGASNRQIAAEAGVTDQGQISKLLARLQSLELIQNTSLGQPSGEPNRWQLTSRGQHVQHAIGAGRATSAAQNEKDPRS